MTKKTVKKKLVNLAAFSKPGKAFAAELKSNVGKIVEIEKSQKENRTAGEKISVVIAEFCGSMTFVWVHVIWFAAWALLNSVFRFYVVDPFPYTFLTLVVSLEAIFLSTFILISQNNETKLTERRNHLDLQINILSEQENTKMLEILLLIAEKVGVARDDPATAALLETMEPKNIVRQIMKTNGDNLKKRNQK